VPYLYEQSILFWSSVALLALFMAISTTSLLPHNLDKLANVTAVSGNDFFKSADILSAAPGHLFKLAEALSVSVNILSVAPG
jgi:hypothetical protein